MTNFEKYKRLKNILNIEYKGIYLNRVLSVSIWNMANDKKISFSWKTSFKIFFSIDVRKLVYNPLENDILSTFSMKRKDHLELYKAVLQKLENRASFNNTIEFGWRFSFNPISMIRIIKSVFYCLRNEKFSFYEKWKMATYFRHFANTIDELDKIDFSSVKKYLSMISMYGFDNLLTQYMKKMEIKTYSLQEGAYSIYTINPPIDSICYENLETDCLLSWGQYSIDEFQKYGISNERLILAGYPKIVHQKSMKVHNKFRKGMILLARDSFRSTNILLLNILLKRTNQYLFHVKLHPSSDYDFYKKYTANAVQIISQEKTINDCLNDDYDFSIAVNTTTYYEALLRGIPCLRFSDNTFDLMYGGDDVFYNDEQFDFEINKIMNKPISKYQNEINSILKHVLGLGIDMYQKILS
jgi:hypothetical protein